MVRRGEGQLRRVGGRAATERGYGRFIIVASLVGLFGDPETGTYGLTKAADMQLVRNMAMEFASKGVCANCIAPGTYKTEMARSQWDNEPMVQWYNSRNPSKRYSPSQYSAFSMAKARTSRTR